MRKTARLILLLFLCSACGKEANQVPDAGVSLAGFFTPGQLSDLKSEGAIFLNGGVAGVIISYNVLSGYRAYDRCSTVNPENKCAVILDNAYTVTDPCTGAKYSLIDGTPAKAPAKLALRVYRIHVEGNNYQVTN